MTELNGCVAQSQKAHERTVRAGIVASVTVFVSLITASVPGLLAPAGARITLHSGGSLVRYLKVECVSLKFA